MTETYFPTGLEQFTFLERIGEGSHCSVFRAVSRADQSILAVKVLKPSKRHSERLSRLKREARALSNLSGVGVLPLLEDGTDSVPAFLAVPYLNGGDLASLRAWNLPRSQWFQILSQLAEGLHHIHQNGVVHRDIKPSNAMFDVQSNGEIRAYWIDFGLACSLNTSKASETIGDTRITRTAVAVGTPGFMAPERWLNGELNPRSDWYSFSLFCYQVLYGGIPELSLSMERIRQWHFQMHLIPPEVDRWGIRVPLSLRDILLQGLQKAPENRRAILPADLLKHSAMPAYRKDRKTLFRRSGVPWLCAVVGVFSIFFLLHPHREETSRPISDKTEQFAPMTSPTDSWTAQSNWKRRKTEAPTRSLRFTMDGRVVELNTSETGQSLKKKKGKTLSSPNRQPTKKPVVDKVEAFLD